ncbi:MAG TPA: serine--tRNA ligase [Candidatus Deferrimicrobium sp.]|nr:serine--tRNA ligase [Candidatus Deferrimicrobium sp.]
MIDIKVFRETPEIIIASEKKRFKDLSHVENVIEFDTKWRETKQQLDMSRKERNTITNKINELKKTGKDFTKEVSRIKSLKTEIPQLEALEKEYFEKREKARYIVGNILHETVPIGKTEEFNKVERIWGKIPAFKFTPKPHVDLVQLIDGADLETAAKVSGTRTYYLKKDLVLLNLGLIQFALDHLMDKGYTPFWTPFFIKFEVMEKAAELADFEQQLYRLEGTDLFLIATSEQTLAALHMDEIIPPEKLPLKYTAYSTCFRKEAGSHGKDTKGIFRIHQFDKIEQYIYCKPEESWSFHEEMIKISEELFQKLELPYRIVNIASGEMNDNAAKKYDLEGWFPAQNTYRELVSCSNCTDYQARKLNVRYGIQGALQDPHEKHPVVHTLNSTAIATERTICCILENHQNEDGSINIPPALQKYMKGKKKIP